MSLNHIKFYDDIKLFAKTPDDLNTLVSLVERFGQEIRFLKNAKKCAYSLEESLNSSKLEEMAYADYNELKTTYKYLGIDEDQYGCNMEENVKRIYEAIEKSLNLVLSSPLSISDMIKAINTCILLKVLYIFSHQGEPTLRSKIAQKIDLIIRKFMNEHKIKLSKITNARLNLSKKNMGLELKNTQIELDKINLKLYVHIHYSKLFKDLRNKLIGYKNLFSKLANIYGLKVEYQNNHLIINEKIFESEKKCNKYIVESIDKVDESFWLTKYSKNRIYPATVISQKLCTPRTWYNDLSPKMYKNITMIQESIHPQLNNPANPKSKCELKNKDGHKCGKFGYPNHILSEFELNNGNKKIRHNKILHLIVNTISMAKSMKYLSY
uniref:Reverse transcriptase domain-containing protein n=1 Tax=Strongyloides venezuelensis TaxID=75913 RepID=A0A0K0FTC2_STRVS